MFSKILVVIFAFVAGGGGAYAYQLTSEYVDLVPQKEEDQRVQELEHQLADAIQKVQELSAAQQASSSESEMLAARLNTLDGRVSELAEKNGELAMANGSSGEAGKPSGATVTTAEGRSDSALPARRISGEELVVALQEMPDEGKEMIRKAIHKEIQRIKKEQEAKQDPRKGLEQKVARTIKEAAQRLSLTPVQVELAKEVGARHIDRILEVQQIARETNDPEYAKAAKKELQDQVEKEVIEILTPEQVDMLRDLDPDGFGRRHPRGF